MCICEQCVSVEAWANLGLVQVAAVQNIITSQFTRRRNEVESLDCYTLECRASSAAIDSPYTKTAACHRASQMQTPIENHFETSILNAECRRRKNFSVNPPIVYGTYSLGSPTPGSVADADVRVTVSKFVIKGKLDIIGRPLFVDCRRIRSKWKETFVERR
jgi:hypothetical protein